MPRVVNPLPQLIPQRLAATRRGVAQLLWERVTPLAVWGGSVNAIPLTVEAAAQELRPVQPGEHFGPPHGGWQQRWFRVELPAAADDEAGRRHLAWACDGETTVYIDGRPWAGLDTHHPTCPLPDQAATLWLDCSLWDTAITLAPRPPAIGPYGLRFDGCELRLRDELAWVTHCDLDVLAQLLATLLAADGIQLSPSIGHLPALEACSPLLRRLLRELDDACDAWAADGLPGLHSALAALMARLPAEAWQPVAALIGHAHIDLVWLWPELATERKAVHSVATLLRLMERYPEVTFAGSQPALSRMLEKLAPTQLPEIAAREAEGRWDATGGFEVEPDTNLPSGEALARSLVYGQRKLAALRSDGAPSAVCWLPDVFGYSTSLPQILRLGGVTRFFTTKMTWSSITRFPYTSFVWRGADGSEVLAHLSTTNYNGEVELADLLGAMRGHRQADLHPELLLPTGFGDGGGGLTELMCERARRLADLTGAPRTRWTTADAFFERLERVRERLPVYQGELYLEYHRGTYTTQSELKRHYRAAETALRAHEAVRVATGGGPLGEDAWLRVLFAQFHDALPGSSIQLVYAQLNAELAAIVQRELDAAVVELSDDASAALLVFNPLPVPRAVVVDAPDGPAFARLAPLAGGRLSDAGQTDYTPIQRATPTLLDNGVVQARFDARGQLVELVIDGAPLELDGPCGFTLHHDAPANFDAWDIDHYSERAGWPVADDLPLELIEHGPLRAGLRGVTPLGAASRLTVEYTLEAESRHLRVVARVEWHERHRLLRYHTPTRYRGRWARYGCPFGSIERPQQPGREADEALWEVPGSRWAAVLRDDGAGLALLSEAKYGFACRDGDLSLSLLRAPTNPDPEADQGDHVIRFALGRHVARADDARLTTAAAADALFAPLVLARRAVVPEAPFALDQLGSLTPSWVSPAEHGAGYVIRLHETAGGGGAATLRLTDTMARVRLVDFLERDMGELQSTADGVWALPYTPYQVLSVLVTPA
jgi:alpha-mannosidase